MSVALYGLSQLKRKEDFKHRKIMKILWTEKVSEKEVLARAIKSRNIWRCIQSGRREMVGQILRHDGQIKTMIEDGTVLWAERRDRPRLYYVKRNVHRRK